MPRDSDLFKGSLFVLVAFFCMAVFGIFTKFATREPGYEIWVSFLTYLTGSVALLPYILWKGASYLRSEHYGLHFMRAGFGLAASFLYMISMQHIPIVNATLLFNTTPIFIPLLACLWLKQKIPFSTWLAVFLGFIGIVIIIKPNAEVFSQLGDLIGLASGISLAVAYLSIKLLTPTDPAIRIIFYYFFIGACLQIPLAFYGSVPNWENCSYAIAAGLMLLLAQVSLVRGYQYADPSQVGVYQYTSIVWVGIFEWILFGVVPDKSDLIGALIVAVAGMIIIHKSKQTPKKASI